MKCTRITLVIAIVSVLAACGPPSVEKLTSDVDLLNKTVKKCEEMGMVKAKDDIACQNALKASVGRASNNAAEAVNKLMTK